MKLFDSISCFKNNVDHPSRTNSNNDLYDVYDVYDLYDV